MKTRKLLVVVDPARREHQSINWIVQIAQQKRDEQLEIQLFIGFESGDITEPDTPIEVVKSPERSCSAKRMTAGTTTWSMVSRLRIRLMWRRCRQVGIGCGRSKPQALLIRTLANLKQFRGDKEDFV